MVFREKQLMAPSPHVRVLAYSVLVFSFSLVFYILCHRHGMKPPYVLGVLWCPAAAGILTSFLTKKPWHEFGWRLGKAKYLLAGWVIPMTYLWPAYWLVWATGVGGFPNAQTVVKIRSLLHMASEPTVVALITFYLFRSVLSVLRGCVKAAGEEIGWRGFLVPELMKVTSFTRTALISGLIWTAWHAPLIIWSDYNSGAPTWYALICFGTMVISVSFLFAWIRCKSGSVWPAVLLHASHNAIIQGFLDPLTIDKGRTRYFAGEFGCAMLPFVIFCAWLIWRVWSQAELNRVNDSGDTATP